ncbi:MAG TPA: MFS transporter, partial [Opitutaceae bacterium]|nr:MFS transporter [Opitutaceae bacterium]
VALVVEVWPEKYRPLLAGVIGAAANIGFALIAVIGLFIHVTPDSWRWVVLIGAAPAAITFVIRWFVPESEKWQEASRVSPARPVREIMRSAPLRKMTLLGSVFAGIALIGSWGSVQWLPLWADQMAGPSQPTAKAYTQALGAIGSVVGCLLGSWLGGRFGRRPAYFILCLASLLSCAWLFRGVDSYGGPFLALCFIVGTSTAAFYG